MTKRRTGKRPEIAKRIRTGPAYLRVPSVAILFLSPDYNYLLFHFARSLHGAQFCADAALCAGLIINNNLIIDHVDGNGRA